MLLLQLIMVSSIAILAFALMPTAKICQNDVRLGWRALFVLIVFFIIGYVGFLFMLFDRAYSEVYLLVTLVLLGGSSFVGLVIRLSLNSISDAQQRAQVEEYNALHDALTSLPNRKYFFNKLDDLILASKQEEVNFAVLMVDLDRFKEINDTLGHSIGDKVLKEIAERFKNNIGSKMMLARLGGDEFALIIPDVDEMEAVEVGKVLAIALEPVLLIEGYSLTVDMSVGVAMFPRDGDDRQVLLKRADVAMYQAKRTQTTCLVYDESLDQHSVRRLQLIPKLKEALEKETFELHYQPILDAETGLPEGLEALIRWTDSDGKQVSPAEFIPLAEQTNCISEITIWVIKKALIQIKQWREHYPDLKMHINLSAIDALDVNLPKKVEEMLTVTGLPSSVLKFEITESAMILDIDRVKTVLNHFDLLGISVSIDDFGTGFSSLSLLRELPTKEIKIDRSFVIGMEKDASNQSIVRATVDLAHSIQREIIAEGVENAVVQQMLSDMGCDLLQGYYICRPLSVSDMTHWLEMNYEIETIASNF
jgi:diguanylate cyclase (GGDEF)-like protein